MVTSRRPVIALDGPASSGKSSVGAAVARRLGWRFLDTGLLYRAITWLAVERGLDLRDGPAIARLAPEVEIVADAAGRLDRVVVGGEDVSDRIRTAGVDRLVSEVARQPEVRAALLVRQRALAADGWIVMAGRDIGTVVLPEADVKVWLDASPEVRAARRVRERGLDPAGREAAAILADLRDRDHVDGSRATAPARPADDALHVATDELDLAGTVDAVIAAIAVTGLDAPASAQPGEPAR